MIPPKQIDIGVSPEQEGHRLDKVLSEILPDFSRSFLQKLIIDGQVKVDGRAAKPAYRVSAGQHIRITIPPPRETEIIPEKIPLSILYEDNYLLVVDKPAGMVVHPGAGIHRGTLINALMYHCPHLSGIGGRLRPGIVHRLDKNTSGLLVVAKDDKTHLGLSRQFASKTAGREYRALVWHPFKESEGTIETFLNRSKRDRTLYAVAETGRKAVTHYLVERQYRFLAYLRIQLKTGRTHQIRVHMNHIHHPVFGDPDYHGREGQLNQLSRQADRQAAKKLLGKMPRQALHASQLTFRHPITGDVLTFRSDLPADMAALLRELDKSIDSVDFKN